MLIFICEWISFIIMKTYTRHSFQIKQVTFIHKLAIFITEVFEMHWNRFRFLTQLIISASNILLSALTLISSVQYILYLPTAFLLKRNAVCAWQLPLYGDVLICIQLGACNEERWQSARTARAPATYCRPRHTDEDKQGKRNAPFAPHTPLGAQLIYNLWPFSPSFLCHWRQIRWSDDCLRHQMWRMEAVFFFQEETASGGIHREKAVTNPPVPQTVNWNLQRLVLFNYSHLM